MSSRVRMDVPFPDAGEGITIKFSNADIRELDGVFGKQWFKEIIERFDRFDVNALQKCADVACRKDGQKIKVNLDDIEAPLLDLFRVFTDAIYICVHGKTFAELLVDQMKRTQAADAAENP